ncbi:MAG: hypothetical protein V2A65_09195 [Candidatus Omnitrophota bacterium]
MFKLIATLLVIGSITSLGKTGKETILNLINSVKYTITGNELVEIDQALQRHEIMEAVDAGSSKAYPADEEFKQFMEGNFTSKGGLRKVGKDFWDNDLCYHRSENGYEIRSFGPDKQSETQDDLYLIRDGDNMKRGLGLLENKMSICETGL